MYQLSTWQVEVSDGLKYVGNKESAYREAEKLQSGEGMLRCMRMVDLSHD